MTSKHYIVGVLETDAPRTSESAAVRMAGYHGPSSGHAGARTLSRLGICKSDATDDHELVAYLRRCDEADNHRFADVAGRFGEEALLDSHLPTLDLIDELAKEWQAMNPVDERYAGLAYALRAIARAYSNDSVG